MSLKSADSSKKHKLDEEPNPFERSFSTNKDSASSSSNSSSNTKDNADSPKPTLPPLASITSPSDPSYPWAALSNSLRSGPLSPAMLAGPSHSSSVASQPLSLSSMFRTGLTPSTGLTPLVGGPVAFPPPSPNTAAFLAMVGNGSNPTALAAAAATITPNTLSALTGVLQGQYQQSAQNNNNNAPSLSSVTGANANAVAPSQVQLTQTRNDQNTAANAAANGLFLLSQAHQELTKREEAQKAAASVSASSQGNENVKPPGSIASAAGKRGSKRKLPTSTQSQSTAGVKAQPQPANKRPRGSSSGTHNTSANNNKTTRRDSVLSTSAEEDFMLMGVGMDGEEEEEAFDEEDMAAVGKTNPNVSSSNGGGARNNVDNDTQKKPETEEEKRKNFLERNRQAALKCRQRKKAWLANLQAKVEFLSTENERLTSALVAAREEIARLSGLVGVGAAGVGMAGVGVANGLGVGVGNGMVGLANGVGVNGYHVNGHQQQQQQQQQAYGIKNGMNGLVSASMHHTQSHGNGNVMMAHQHAHQQHQPTSAARHGQSQSPTMANSSTNVNVNGGMHPPPTVPHSNSNANMNTARPQSASSQQSPVLGNNSSGNSSGNGSRPNSALSSGGDVNGGGGGGVGAGPGPQMVAPVGGGGVRGGYGY